MASPFQQAGAAAEPTPFAALHTNRIFTGLWSNRSALRDAATSYLQEKYYTASRQDSIWDGLNTEISSRLTLIRRPGHSVYNAQIFPPINRFYEFRSFSSSAERIRVMADTSGAVYDATGPNTKLNIWQKSAGAGATYFQGVGNTLFMGNGVDQIKWVQSTLSWGPQTTFRAGNFVVDPNGNLQVVQPAVTAQIASVVFSGTTVYIYLQGPNPFPVGSSVVASGLTSATVLNGATLGPTATPFGGYFPNALTAPFSHAQTSTTPDTGTLSTAYSMVTGAAAPVWNASPGGATFDGGVTWVNKGPAVQGWGIQGPTAAPTLAQATLPSIYPQWQANTTYSASLLIVDANNNIQKLTTGGTTGSAAPIWHTSGTTTDGTAVWTYQGSAAWAANTSFAVGALVSVTFTYYIQTQTSSYDGPQYPSGEPYNEAYYRQQQSTQTQSTPVTVTDFFRATAAGVSGAYAPTWIDGAGSVVSDGSVTWTNQGSSATWSSAVGPAASILLAQTIVDANGNLQTVLTSGKSGSTHPAWQTQQGATTVDGTASWTAGGAYSAGASSPQIYSFAFGCSTTGAKSNRSPLSVPITLGANSLVNLQGQGSADPQVDTIYLYRTLKGGSTQFLMDQIPAPAPGQVWSYSDTTPDAALTLEIQAASALELTPPPAGAIAPAYHLQRLFVAVQNVLYWSVGPDAIVFAADGNSGFPPANAITYPSRIVRMWPCALGLIVYTVSDIFIVLGSGTANDPLYTTPFLENLGLLSFDAWTVNGTTAYMLSTANQLISLDPGAGVVEVGFPIADILEANYTGSAHLTFHAQSSADTALYAADGATGWYRMAATTAPESGTNWSPRAVITGGCTALRSVEVLPGQNRLLLGPGTTGPILQRDRTVNLDNGAAFPAWTTLGSIVLAQPGQVAAIEFFTLESMRVGSTAGLAVLLGEISGTFEMLDRTRQDPPCLEPSQTLYSDRYHLSQNGLPVVCRHFQMKVIWPSEDAPNELLSFTIFGSLLSEFKAT